MMEENLQDILSGKEPVDVPETGEAAKPEVTAPPAEVKEEPKLEEKAPEVKAAEPDKPKPRADVAAIIDERRKRQALERQIEELRSKTPEAKTSVFDDEDKAINSRVTEGTRGLRETLYKQSMKIARLQHGDVFSEAEEAFAQAADSDPRLIAALQASDDPGDFVFTMGLQIKELADVGGDFLKYREKVTSQSAQKLNEAGSRIKALEAQVAQLTQEKADIEAIPRNLNSKSSAAPKAGEEDEESISKITRFGNKQR